MGATWGERVDAGEQPAEAYMVVTELAATVGAAPIKDKLWVHDIDERWRVTANGYHEPMQVASGPVLEPFHLFIEYNGWPAGILGLFDGVIAAGQGANEDTFIAAVRAAIDHAR